MKEDYTIFNKLIVILGIGIGFAPLTAMPSQIVRLHVDQQADVYNVHVEMSIDAPAERVRRILTDYGNLERLSRSITSSRIIDSASGDSVRVVTRFRKCVLFFCMNLQKVEDISEDRDGRIIVAMVPDASSFRSGHASWEVQSTDGGSRVIHHARLEPDLQLPAWLGPSIIKKTLLKELQESFENIECLSRFDCDPQPELTRDQKEVLDDDQWNS